MNEVVGEILRQILPVGAQYAIVGTIFQGTGRAFLSNCPKIGDFSPLNRLWYAAVMTPFPPSQNLREHSAASSSFCAKGPGRPAVTIRLAARPQGGGRRRPFRWFSLAKLKSAIVLLHLYDNDSQLMRKFLSFPLFVLLASVVLVSGEPWTVIRVYKNSFMVRSTTLARSPATLPNATPPRGTTRIEHFSVTQSTKFFVNGNKGSFTDVRNGVHVNVKSHSGDADRVDVVP